MSEDLIKRSDAIGAITNHCENECYYRVDNWCPQCQREEFEEAIKAVPSADRPTWIPSMNILFKGNLEEGNYTLIKSTDIWHMVSDAPSIDIVRCKECKWGKPYSDKQLECDAPGLGGLKFPDDFCSYGEREGE